MELPYFQTNIKELSLMMTTWRATLNALLALPQNQSVILKKVPLNNGVTNVNHLLGRTLIGWKIVRQRASASIWDSQDSNQTPAATLVLNSNAAVTVDIEVF